MILENKTAVIYGGSGDIGGAVARAFAREGARVFLAGRTLAKLEAAAEQIRAAGGAVDVAQVEATDKQSIEQFLSDVVGKTGRVDVSFNAIDIKDRQGALLVDMEEDDFSITVNTAMKTHFLTATAAARHMATKGSGVILAITANVARHPVPNVGGFGVACAAIEALCRQLAVELGPQGIRVVCMRSAGSPDARGLQEVFAMHAQQAGISFEEFLVQATKGIPLRKMPLMDDIGRTAAFMASDQASAITAEVVNLTGGQLFD